MRTYKSPWSAFIFSPKGKHGVTLVCASTSGSECPGFQKFIELEMMQDGWD